jgi:hypothetical protein
MSSTSVRLGAQVSGNVHHCLRLDRRISGIDITLDGRYIVMACTRSALVFDALDPYRPPVAQLNRRGASYNVAHKQVNNGMTNLPPFGWLVGWLVGGIALDDTHDIRTGKLNRKYEVYDLQKWIHHCFMMNLVLMIVLYLPLLMIL